MSETHRWRPGSVVVYREVWRGAVWTARPVLAVQDSPELVALYLPNYTCWKLPAGGRLDYFTYLSNGHWRLTNAEWQFGDTLFLIRPGAAHAVHVMWAPSDRAFVGWYVNFQEPIRRTTVGFDFMDRELDLVVHPDLSWYWKDEDHLRQAGADGRYSADELAAIRAESGRVVDLIEARSSPFTDGWEAWQPPAGWTRPELPDEWNVL